MIIEDEMLAAEKLKMLLGKIDGRLQVVGTLGTVADSVVWLANNEADLIFLDINLSDDISFKIFEQVQVDTPIIFTTAYDQYAIKAFKQNSIDYILKPVTEEDLRTSLAKYQKLKPNTDSNGLQSLLATYLGAQPYKSRILVTYGGKAKSLPIEEVAYAYAYDKGVYLATFDGGTFLADDTLDTLEQAVDPKYFFRTSRKYLVNIKAISEIYKYSTRRLKLELVPEPRLEAIVPAEKITAFKQWLNA